MDLALSEEQVALRGLAADSVDRAAAPHTAERDRAERVDGAIVSALGRPGLLGPTVDEPDGVSGGGYGHIDEYPPGKYLREAGVTTLCEGTGQIQKLMIGRALTGVNAFI
jgi:alkylation response protein AidB-like acyl-CoA dehydrogenase